jgi:hypothetical protein
MAVSQTAKQVGEIHGKWSWVEPSVWTERMLTANVYFAEHGLFCLVVAYEQTVIPHRGITIDRRAVCGRTARTVRRQGLELG